MLYLEHVKRSQVAQNAIHKTSKGISFKKLDYYWNYIFFGIIFDTKSIHLKEFRQKVFQVNLNLSFRLTSKPKPVLTHYTNCLEYFLLANDASLHGAEKIEASC